MIGSRVGIYASQGGAFVGLLDTYSGASIAYSVRLLSSTYSGALVEIRRSSDSAVKDFYPDSNNELSLTSEDGSGTSLSTWIGSNDGFIRTWYDQSGNTNNATQTTTSKQAKIVTSGSINTLNSKPCAAFDSNDAYSLTSVNIGCTASVVQALTSGTVNYLMWYQAGASGLYIYGGAIGNNVGVFDGGIKSAFANDTNQHLNYWNYNGTNYDLAQDGSSVTSLSSGSIIQVDTLGRDSTNFTINGNFQELVDWPTTQASNKAGIEANINNYFTIY